MRQEMTAALRLSLAHHPLCSWFRSDRIGPFCSGCLVFWPAVFGGLLLGTAVLAHGMPPWHVLSWAALAGAWQAVTPFVRLGRVLRAGIKLSGGLGVGAAAVAFWLLPWHTAWKLALATMALTVVVALLLLRMRSILAVCQACPWRRDWEHCPGFVPGAPHEPPRPAAPDVRRLLPPVT